MDDTVNRKLLVELDIFHDQSGNRTIVRVEEMYVVAFVSDVVFSARVDQLLETVW